MKYKLTTQVVALVVLAVFMMGIWAIGDTVDLAWLRFYSAAVFLATLALNVGDWFVWRIGPIQSVDTARFSGPVVVG